MITVNDVSQCRVELSRITSGIDGLIQDGSDTLNILNEIALLLNQVDILTKHIHPSVCSLEDYIEKHEDQYMGFSAGVPDLSKPVRIRDKIIIIRETIKELGKTARASSK